MELQIPDYKQTKSKSSQNATNNTTYIPNTNPPQYDYKTYNQDRKMLISNYNVNGNEMTDRNTVKYCMFQFNVTS